MRRGDRHSPEREARTIPQLVVRPLICIAAGCLITATVVQYALNAQHLAAVRLEHGASIAEVLRMAIGSRASESKVDSWPTLLSKFPVVTQYVVTRASSGQVLDGRDPRWKGRALDSLPEPVRNLAQVPAPASRDAISVVPAGPDHVMAAFWLPADHGEPSVLRVRLPAGRHDEHDPLVGAAIAVIVASTFVLLACARRRIWRFVSLPLDELRLAIRRSGRLTELRPLSPDAPRELLELHEAFGQQLTARVASEDALDETRAQWDAMTLATPLGVLAIDWLGQATYANEAFAVLADQSVERCLGLGWLDAIHPEDRERLLQEWLDDTMPADALSVVARLAPSGRPCRWIEARAKRIETPVGLGGLIATFADVTDQVAAMDRYRIMLGACQDGLLVIEDDVIVDVNQPAAQMLGYRDASVLLGAQIELLSPERQPDGALSADKGKRMIEVAQREGWHRFFWVHEGQNGAPVPVEVTLWSVSGEAANKLTVSWRHLESMPAELRPAS